MTVRVVTGLGFAFLTACGGSAGLGNQGAMGGAVGLQGGSSGGSITELGGGGSVAGQSTFGGATQGGSAGGGVGGFGAAGSSGSGGEPQLVPTKLGESSWDVNMTMSFSDPFVRCTELPFTMHLAPNDTGLSSVLGRGSAVANPALSAVNDVTQGAYALSATFEIEIKNVPNCSFRSLEISELVIWGSDSNGDGVADRLDGRGTALGYAVIGDLGNFRRFEFALRGSPDRTPPSLVVAAPVDPLSGVSLIASEPLAVTSVVSLVKGEESVPLQPQVGGAPPSIATFQTGNFLPFGSTWQVQATGEDLAGLPITTAEPVVVSTDPGVFAEDGFEAKPSMAVEGGVELVSQVGGVPALSGSQSLLMHSDAVVLFHLSRRAGATAVRFTAQMFSMNADSVSLPPIVAGVIGGSKYLPVRSTPSDSPVVPTMDPSLAYAGPKQEVLLPIGEDGSDIALKIQMRMKCSTFCTDSRALLIDDLRVE